MSEYEIVDTNAENIGGCGFCGYKSGKNEGHRRKVGLAQGALRGRPEVQGAPLTRIR